MDVSVSSLPKSTADTEETTQKILLMVRLVATLKESKLVCLQNPILSRRGLKSGFADFETCPSWEYYDEVVICTQSCVCAFLWWICLGKLKLNGKFPEVPWLDIFDHLQSNLPCFDSSVLKRYYRALLEDQPMCPVCSKILRTRSRRICSLCLRHCHCHLGSLVGSNL